MRLSHRGDIPPFVVMEMSKAAFEMERAGRQVFHLEVGQPATQAPALARAAARRSLDDDLLAYTDANGVPALRERIARHYAERYGVEIPAERVIATTGSSAGFLLTFLAAFDAGARVAVAAPSYPCYRNVLSAVDVNVVAIPVGPETHYQVTPALLEAHGPFDGVIVASPSNPTGSIIDHAAMSALADYCRAAAVTLISDEIYQGLEYATPAVTATAYDDQAIVLNSFSKYYSMTGWRIGWMIAPPQFVRPIEKLAQNLYISPPTISQIAAAAAFDAAEELDGHVARYRINRDIVLAALPDLGVTQFAPPDGAFYVYADVSHLTDDSVRFCRELLENTGVAVTPGVDFDIERGRSSLRISYARDPQTVAEAMRRMTEFARR
jgi:aspartate/methionine/tyrosine aminotransferase